MNRVPTQNWFWSRRHVNQSHRRGRKTSDAQEMARYMIHNIQPDLDILKGGRPIYSTNPDSLIAACHVAAIEFSNDRRGKNYSR